MKRQFTHIIQRKVSLVLTLLLIVPISAVSCGGSGGGSTFAGGGVSGTGVSVGVITGFGSVILNNSTYEVTPSTSIIVNDISGLDQDDLKLGMVATVEFDGTEATMITADDELRGRVDSINQAGNTLTVMGTEVIVDNNTVFDDISPADLSGLNAGDYVEVHGLYDFLNNNVRATRIEKIAQPGTEEFEVKGRVSNFDNPPGTFSIANLTVNYALNNVQLPQGMGNESFVEAKGRLNGGTLEAVSVEREDDFPDLDPDDAFEIEGIITFIDDPQNPSQIIINGITILVSGARIEHGDLIVGVRAEAEGFINEGGSFVAVEIEIEDSVEEGEGSGDGDSIEEGEESEDSSELEGDDDE